MIIAIIRPLDKGGTGDLLLEKKLLEKKLLVGKVFGETHSC
jgi:hypothetical protein